MLNKLGPLAHPNSKIDLRLSEPPISIEIDPNFNVFRKLGPSETSPILRDITLNSNSIVFLISSNKKLRNIAKKLANKFRVIKVLRDNQEIIDKSSVIFLGITPSTSPG